MSEPMDPRSWDEMTDDELVALLGEAVGEAVAEDDAVSDRRRAAARGAFAWRSVDEELAELLHDSALEAGAAVRSGTDGPRTLSFGGGGLTLELEVDGDGLLGEVVGGGDAASVALQRPGVDEVTTVVGAGGFFRFDAVGQGAVRLVVTGDAVSLTTTWFTL